MNVPFVDLKAQYNSIKKEIDSAVKDVLESCSFILGEQVSNFENEFARYCGKRFAIGTSCGTSALHLALIAAGIKKGDEVITTPHTFIATAEAIRNCGADFKFADIESEGYLIDAGKIEDAITDKTKAILPVHLYGQTADMDSILKLAKKHNLKLIEDAAQAHGAEYRGKKAPISDIGIFSFYPAKNLGAYGDAGCVATDDEEIKEEIAMLRDHGRKLKDKYKHTICGFADRLDALQAAILSVKLRHLDKWNDARRKNAKLYNELLDGVVKTPVELKDRKHVYHIYAIRTKKRDKLIDFLKKKGIFAGIHYPIPLHLQPAYSDLGYKEGDFPATEQCSRELLSLPMFPELSEGQINYVAGAIKEFSRE